MFEIEKKLSLRHYIRYKSWYIKVVSISNFFISKLYQVNKLSVV